MVLAGAVHRAGGSPGRARDAPGGTGGPEHRARGAGARGAVRHLPGGHPVPGRPAGARQDGRGLAGADGGLPGGPGRRGRHRSRAARGCPLAPTAADLGDLRSAPGVPRAARPGGQGEGPPGGHRPDHGGDRRALRAGEGGLGRSASPGGMSGALLIAGTTSDAGKSVVTAGICRWLARQGVSVAPFKAQNMSNNSMVTADGAEIGRAQVMQAAAARVEPEAAMNPVLLKPGGENASQVVVLGKPVADVTALSYRPMKAALLEQALACLADLRSRFDVVICEGAGSPTEINLRADDIANMGLATAADLPVVVVGDIDRGGVFAALYGTVALMPPADQRLVAGFLVNKFRGDARLLTPGLHQLAALTGRPTLGVLPWRTGLHLDVEDSLGVEAPRGPALPPHGEDVLRVSVARLPRLSNFTDLDALAAEPGVLLRYADRPEELADADLVVLPGTRSTVADLQWLRATGLADAVARRAAER